MQPQNPITPQDPITPQNPVTPPEPAQFGDQHPGSYDFITNPGKPGANLTLSGANPMLKRVLILGVGLIILIVGFSVVKKAVTGTPKLDSMVTVAQDQSEIIHLAAGTSTQLDLTTANKDLAANSLLSLTSSQSRIMTYLSSQHFKVKSKTLRLKLSASIDNQLINAEAAGTYNPTFQDTMKSQLSIYSGDLQQAYKQIAGKKGRALLSDDYSQAQLLLSQATTPTAAN